MATGSERHPPTEQDASAVGFFNATAGAYEDKYYTSDHYSFMSTRHERVLEFVDHLHLSA